VHLFGLEAVHLVFGDNCGLDTLVLKRQPFISGKRLRGKRSGRRACSECGGASGNSKGEFQKVAAFHSTSSFALGDTQEFDGRCMNGR
jgi:hypothetical protein